MIRYLLAVLTLAACTPTPGIAITPRPTTKPATNPPSATAAVEVLNAVEICSQHDTLTNVQWTAYIDSLQGRRVLVSGAVEDVVQDGLSNKYYVRLDLGNYNRAEAWDLDSQTALALKKGQRLRVTANIEGANYLFICSLVLVKTEVVP